MSYQFSWIDRKLRLGWILIIAGVILVFAGILMGWLIADLPFNERIITALGILLLAIGISLVVKYTAASRDREAARRLTANERDERMMIIRGRAGYRGFWVSIGLSYAVLMWLSLADSGSLPPISSDTLWFAMAGVVLVPMLVYIVSIIRDNERF